MNQLKKGNHLGVNESRKKKPREKRIVKMQKFL